MRLRLSMLVSTASYVLILLWVLRPESSGLPDAPVLRSGLALALAGLSTWMAWPGQRRRFVGGWLFGAAICSIVVQYGARVGIHAFWQRAVVGVVLSSPFIYLFLTNGAVRKRDAGQDAKDGPRWE